MTASDFKKLADALKAKAAEISALLEESHATAMSVTINVKHGATIPSKDDPAPTPGMIPPIHFGQPGAAQKPYAIEIITNVDPSVLESA